MDEIQDIVKKQREFFATGKTKEIAFRAVQLKKLGESIRKHEEDISLALKKDLNKAPFEAYGSEIGIVLDELRFAAKHFRSWSAPRRVKTSITNFLSSSKIYQEPYGVVLVISPWNYPFQLTMNPIIGAIAAGNCIVVKPSNYSPNTSKVIEVILSEVFDKDYIAVIQGGREANKSLLEQKFDYIFFTGSVAVGKTVMEAAAKYVTPVTLELGGKSPCIVDETANINLAAKRIAWGKLINAGQTCVAPDYLLVHHSVKEELLTKIKAYVLQFYGENPISNTEFPRIINEKHYNRLLSLLEGEHIVFGGEASSTTNQIAPTVLDQITWDSPIMTDEIFGPILPVIEYQNLDEEITRINNRPKPLALYYFTRSKENEKKVISNISYGGGCINDTVMHLASNHMPFGGVGESGMGGYHGNNSFNTFSHPKSVLKKSNKIDVPLRYPPYKNNLKLLKMILK